VGTRYRVRKKTSKLWTWQ